MIFDIYPLSLFSFYRKVEGTRLLYKLEVINSCNLNLGGKALHPGQPRGMIVNYRFKDTLGESVRPVCVLLTLGKLR